MRKILSIVLVVLLLSSAMPRIVTPAAAYETKIPCDNGDNKLTKDELVKAILPYMLDEGKYSLDEIGDAAYVYAHWDGEPKTIIDMAGYEITFYKPPERVIAISRSLIDTTMYIFGVEELLVGGSYFAETSKTKYIYNGVDYTVNTQVQLVLVPKIKKLPNVGGFGSGPYGIVSTEKIASLNPDLLIVRDFCNCDEEDFNRPISIIRGLGISVVILKYLNCYDEPEVSTIYDEIELLGKIFDNQEKAAEINEYLDYQVQFITERTKEIKEEDKPRVLYFGIPSWAGEEGGTGVVFGVDQIESVLLEKVINAKNAYAGTGTPIISSEQLLALDPDIIILPTYSGYHPPREMYEEGRFANIQELRALKERRIHSLATMPCKSERLEFPINLMIEAKAVYPERFEDIDLDEWIDNYFQGLYHIDDKTVEELKKTQMLYYLEITTEK